MREVLFSEGTVRRRHGAVAAPGFLDELFEVCAQGGLSGSAASWAWEITAYEPELEEGERRAVVALVLASLLALREGSTRVPIRGDLAIWLKTAAEPFIAESAEAWHSSVLDLIDRGALSVILGGPGDYKPLILEGDWLYHQRIHVYEERFAKVVTRRLMHDQTASIDDHLADVLARPAGAVELEVKQQNAVRLAATHPLSVVTGGPGTGKTTIVVSVLRVLMRAGVTADAIALAAPTGKAANRLGESIDKQLSMIEEPAADDDLLQELKRPQTLHRLLRYSRKRGTFFHNADNPLPHRWVIVDEASMIDLVLMERLMASLRDDASIVLLGDAEQLPSVDTGTILRDLIPVEGAPNVVRLTHSHRVREDDPESARILQTADLIREGQAQALLADSSPMRRCAATETAERGVDFVELQKDISPIRTLLELWSEDIVSDELEANALTHIFEVEGGVFGDEDQGRLRLLFEHLGRSRILCLTRVFPTGAIAINTYFHRKLAIRAGVSTSTEWVPGEPVLMLANDYDRGLFNGDQGIIVRARLTDEDESLVVVFGHGTTFRAFHLSSLRSKLDRAFAMTVHKSQGSEFDRVLLVLPTDPIPLLTREIIYTAITRAREHAVVVGPRAILAAGVTAKIRRFSGVRERLRGIGS